MPYRWISLQSREGLHENGIPVWFSLAWNSFGPSLFTSIFSGALFSDAGNLLRKRKKPPFPLKEERLIIRSWKPAPFLKMKKAGILMASRHKNPDRFKNDNFLKTLYKISALFQISSENKKGAAQSLTAYDWHSSKDASQRVCIYGTAKNRVHILPLISEQISVDYSWNYPKKHFRCNLFQVASKVLNKHVIITHFRYCFSATENNQQSFKISNISFASFDITGLILKIHFPWMCANCRKVSLEKL